MAHDRIEAQADIPTSVHLSKMLDRAEEARVSIGWLMEQLGRRSFGLTLFVMAVIALLPGASTIVGVLVAWPAVQMILGQDVATLPRPLARRKIDTDRLARIIGSWRRDSPGSSGSSARADQRPSRPLSG